MNGYFWILIFIYKSLFVVNNQYTKAIRTKITKTKLIRIITVKFLQSEK